jgi:hypothetical protein
MSTSKTSGGCKDCTRIGRLLPTNNFAGANVPPPILLGEDINGEFTANAGAFGLHLVQLEFLDETDSGDPKDLADHAVVNLVNAFAKLIQDLVEQAKNDLNVNLCYELSWPAGATITIKSTCNNKDIREGRGPGSSDVNIELNGPAQFKQVSCGTFS